MSTFDSMKIQSFMRKKTLFLALKTPYLGNLGQKLLSYLESSLSNLLNHKVSFKTKKFLKLRLKIVICDILNLLFEKAVVSFDIISLAFLILASVVSKQRLLNLGPNLSFM